MKFVCAVFLILGSLVAGSTPASADTIIFEAEMVLDHRSATGTDSLGLDGATFVFRSEFDTAQTYFDRFGLPTLDSVADSLTISGASMGATNGAYSSTEGIGFYPTLGGQQFGGGPNGDFAHWNVGGSILTMRNFLTSIGGIFVGDNVAISHFSTTQKVDPPQFDDGLFFVGNFTGSPRYDLSSFSAKVTSVPEPSTLALLGIGAIAVAWRRRRRS